MTCVRTIDQIGVYKSCDHKYPVFDTPIPPIDIGDTVVLKYIDESTEVVAIQSNDSIGAPRCSLCKYGTQTENCPVHYHGGWDCIFTCGYAISVDRILEEL